MDRDQIVSSLLAFSDRELLLLALQLPEGTSFDELRIKMYAITFPYLVRIKRVFDTIGPSVPAPPSKQSGGGGDPVALSLFGAPISRLALLKAHCALYCENFKRYERKLLAAHLGTRPKHLTRSIANSGEAELETLFELCRALAATEQPLE